MMNLTTLEISILLEVSMIKIVKYTPNLKLEWDHFVTLSDTPVFMFNRDYMEYHQYRFVDYSLMLYKKDKLQAILPGHITDKEYHSHSGLTFGGFILKTNTSFSDLILFLNYTNEYLHEIGIKSFKIKLQPSFYSNSFSDAQSFLLIKSKIPFEDIKLSTCISTRRFKFPKSTVEKRKLKLNNFHLKFSDDFESYWKILENNLDKFHNTQPVHTIAEIRYLQNLFPEKIKLFIVENRETGNIDAGAVLYEFNNVLKLQYLAASETGRTNRASHALYYGFISEYLDKVDYIDLGNCMEPDGEINQNLLYIKERFGATIYSMLTYKFDTTLRF
nr:hypothetical protein [uncultured Carboxylicivirga sp.]